MLGLVGGLAIVAVVALLQGTAWKQRLFGKVDAGPIRSVAVLPLQNLSNDPNQEYFVDGMTDELITDLAQIRELKVVSKTSIMQYKGTRIPLPQIGRRVGSGRRGGGLSAAFGRSGKDHGAADPNRE